MFDVSADQVGGIVNCPACGKATSVEGLNDPLYRIFQVVGIVVALGVAVGLGLAVSPFVGVIVGVGLLGLLYVIRFVF